MKFHRIYAIILHYWYHSKKSVPRIFDIFYWPGLELLVWGLISTFLGRFQVTGFNAVSVLLGAIIFWNILRRSQQDVSVNYLEDIWSRNFMNLFVSPLKISEYLVGGIIVAIIKCLIVIVYMSVLAVILYHFNILTVGWYLVPFAANLMFFGWALGIFTNGLILRYGVETQVFAFSMAFLMQPLSAVFYPLSILPVWLQHIAWCLPSTHIFEGMRQVLSGAGLSAEHLVWAVGLNIVFMILASLFYAWAFRRVRELGTLSKEE